MLPVIYSGLAARGGSAIVTKAANIPGFLSWIVKTATQVGGWVGVGYAVSWFEDHFGNDKSVSGLIAEVIADADGSLRAGALSNHSLLENSVALVNLELWQANQLLTSPNFVHVHKFMPGGYSAIAARMRLCGFSAGAPNSPIDPNQIGAFQAILSSSTLTSLNILSALNVPGVSIVRLGGITFATTYSSGDKSDVSDFNKMIRYVKKNMPNLSQVQVFTRSDDLITCVQENLDDHTRISNHILFDQVLEIFGALVVDAIHNGRFVCGAMISDSLDSFLPKQLGFGFCLGNVRMGNVPMTSDLQLKLEKLEGGQDFVTSVAGEIGLFPSFQFSRVPILPIKLASSLLKKMGD